FLLQQQFRSGIHDPISYGKLQFCRSYNDCGPR
ncbi:unnamed protein product, partial [Rotaria sp. Silwood2]